jgi:hypothetical protein
MIDNNKQWFLLILAAAWLFIALALAAGVYFATPSRMMLRQLYRYYFPPSAADYELQKLKLQIKSDQTSNRKRTRP